MKQKRHILPYFTANHTKLNLDSLKTGTTNLTSHLRLLKCNTHFEWCETRHKKVRLVDLFTSCFSAIIRTKKSHSGVILSRLPAALSFTHAQIFFLKRLRSNLFANSAKKWHPAIDREDDFFITISSRATSSAMFCNDFSKLITFSIVSTLIQLCDYVGKASV